MIKVRANGDKFLSDYDKKMWNFTHNVMIKFGCPIQFKVFEPDVTNQLDKIVQFFVPKGRNDVTDHISQEFENQITESKMINGEWMWGVDVRIFELSG